MRPTCKGGDVAYARGRSHSKRTFFIAAVVCFWASLSKDSFAATPITIMPMGDSITVGADYLTHSLGGYRDPLYRDLSAVGISPVFVGASTSNPTANLTSAGQVAHNGYGSWHIRDLDNNLNGNVAPMYGGDNNQGGYFLTGGHNTGRSAVSPAILLLEVGTNDLLQGNPNINSDLYALVTDFHALSPSTTILIAGVTPINSSGFTASIAAYNSYIKNQLVPSLSYTRYVNQNSGFLNGDGSVNAALLGSDNVHPDRYGYPIVALHWAAAIEALEAVSPGGHMLTVNGGSGGGVFPAGTVLTVGANAPAMGSQFSNWTPVTTALSNLYSSWANYTMPATAATISANFAISGSPTIPNGTYQISTPYDGLAMGAASATGGAAIQQQTFTGTPTQAWNLTNVGSNHVSLTLAGTNLALEVPLSSAAITGASLDLAAYGGSSNQQWQIAPTDGNMQLLNVSSGEAVNITGYSTSPGTSLLQYPAGSVNEMWNFFPVSSSSTLYPLTVNNGSGGGTYPAGTTVAVTANAPATGYQFSGWVGGISNLANVSSAATTLITASMADTITATYAPVATYTLTVSNGSGSGSYPAGSVVTVTANAPASGSQFAGWTGATATLANNSSATTTLTVPTGGVAIAATYSTPTLGTSLGTFALLAESASSGNAMVVSYGVSSEGGGLVTYWQGPPSFKVLSMGNAQYELVETLGGRCVTVNGAVVAINTCQGTSHQPYGLKKQADGSYVVQTAGGLCLNANGSFSAINALACNASPGELWKFSGNVPLVLDGSATPPSSGTGTVVDSPTVPAGYHLTFDDEFQSLSISDNNGAGTKWYTHTVQCCLFDTSNPNTPTYMAGITDGAGKDPYSLVSGGLDIRLQKTNGAWYSGVLATVDSTGAGFSQQYGYFEMKAMLPNALGTWPAFWLLNSAHLSQNAPAGEIDVFEEYGQFPTYINTTLHDWGASTTPGSMQDQVENTTDGFHVYGMLWTASTMTFYYDGVAYYTLPTPAVMKQPYYPIIDLGLGGGWPTNQTPQTSDMIVKYMRVYSN